MMKHDWKVGDRARIAAYGGFSTANDHLGKEGTITFIYPVGNCDLKTERGLRCGPLKDLEPLPAETPKDPFAPGEYVTCVKVGGPHSPNEGEVFLVDGYHHFDKDWFCALGKIGLKAEVLGYEKSRFRPATPEEIAAYKAKYEADGEERQPEPSLKTYTLTPYIKPETIMLHGVEYLVTENV